MTTSVYNECCFCKKQLVSHHLFKHIIHQHTEQLLCYSNSLTKNEDKRNIAILNKKVFRFEDCFLFTIPNGEFYYCFGCNTGVKRKGFKDKHHKCRKNHLENIEKFYEKYKYLLGDNTPPSEPVKEVIKPVEPSQTASVLTDVSPLQELIWINIKTNFQKVKSEEESRKKIQKIQKISEDKQYQDYRLTFKIKPYEDCQDTIDYLSNKDWFMDIEEIDEKNFEVDNYLEPFEIPESLKSVVTFPIDFETLINKFETVNKKHWLSKIPPTNNLKKPEPFLEIVYEPNQVPEPIKEYKPEENTSEQVAETKQEPIQENKEEIPQIPILREPVKMKAKQLTRSSTMPLSNFQNINNINPPQVQPQLPTIIQTTRR